MTQPHDETACAALVAERDRLREALTEIRDGPEWRHGHPVDIARAALSPENEETEG